MEKYNQKNQEILHPGKLQSLIRDQSIPISYFLNKHEDIINTIKFFTSKFIEMVRYDSLNNRTEDTFSYLIKYCSTSKQYSTKIISLLTKFNQVSKLGEILKAINQSFQSVLQVLQLSKLKMCKRQRLQQFEKNIQNERLCPRCQDFMSKINIEQSKLELGVGQFHDPYNFYDDGQCFFTQHRKLNESDGIYRARLAQIWSNKKLIEQKMYDLTKDFQCRLYNYEFNLSETQRFQDSIKNYFLQLNQIKLNSKEPLQNFSQNLQQLVRRIVQQTRNVMKKRKTQTIGVQADDGTNNFQSIKALKSQIGQMQRKLKKILIQNQNCKANINEMKQKIIKKDKTIQGFQNEKQQLQKVIKSASDQKFILRNKIKEIDKQKNAEALKFHQLNLEHQQTVKTIEYLEKTLKKKNIQLLKSKKYIQSKSFINPQPQNKLSDQQESQEVNSQDIVEKLNIKGNQKRNPTKKKSGNFQVTFTHKDINVSKGNLITSGQRVLQQSLNQSGSLVSQIDYNKDDDNIKEKKINSKQPSVSFSKRKASSKNKLAFAGSIDDLYSSQKQVKKSVKSHVSTSIKVIKSKKYIRKVQDEEKQSDEQSKNNKGSLKVLEPENIKQRQQSIERTIQIASKKQTNKKSGAKLAQKSQKHLQKSSQKQYKQNARLKKTKIQQFRKTHKLQKAQPQNTKKAKAQKNNFSHSFSRQHHNNKQNNQVSYQKAISKIYEKIIKKTENISLEAFQQKIQQFFQSFQRNTNKNEQKILDTSLSLSPNIIRQINKKESVSLYSAKFDQQKKYIVNYPHNKHSTYYTRKPGQALKTVLNQMRRKLPTFHTPSLSLDKSTDFTKTQFYTPGVSSPADKYALNQLPTLQNKTMTQTLNNSDLTVKVKENILNDISEIYNDIDNAYFLQASQFIKRKRSNFMVSQPLEKKQQEYFNNLMIIFAKLHANDEKTYKKIQYSLYYPFSSIYTKNGLSLQINQRNSIKLKTLTNSLNENFSKKNHKINNNQVCNEMNKTENFKQLNKLQNIVKLIIISHRNCLHKNNKSQSVICQHLYVLQSRLQSFIYADEDV